MLGAQETRLIAIILSLLLLGWGVKAWRSQHRIESLPVSVQTASPHKHP
jgi:hypothetical protein